VSVTDLRRSNRLRQGGATARRADGLTRMVAVENTEVYSKPIDTVLEGAFEIVVANAHHVRKVPGRKTDVKDAEWIADLLCHGSLRPSLVPPSPTAATTRLNEPARLSPYPKRHIITVCSEVNTC
jgi:hypothetical protein